MSDSKSEFKRLCTLDPIGMGRKFFEAQQIIEQQAKEIALLTATIESLKAENANLCESFDGIKNVLHDTQKENAALKEKLKQARRETLEEAAQCVEYRRGVSSLMHADDIRALGDKHES